MPDYINRPPRIQPELPAGEVEIPSPPVREAAGGRQMLLQMAVPLITIFGYVMVAGVSGGGGGGSSILFVLPMALSVMATSTMTVLNYFRMVRIDREKQALYAQRLVDLRKQMIASHDKQRAFYVHNYPDIDAITRLVGGVDGHPDSRLWERRTADNDFGAVRLGIGSIRSTWILKPPASDTADAPQLPQALQLAEDSLIVHDIPVTIPLRPHMKDSAEGEDPAALGEKIPAVGRYAVGIAGSDRKQVGDFVRAILVNFACFHSPTDARLYVIGSSDAKADWDWARWLPHTNTSRNEPGKGDQLCFEPRRVRRAWDDLQSELERRQLRASDEHAGDVTLPFILVVVDALSRDAKDSPLGAVSTEAAVSILMTAGPQLGASVIFLVPERAMIPSDCRAVIECETTEVGPAFRYAEVGLNTLRYDGDADTIDIRRADQEFARKIAPMLVRTTFGADLANAVNLLELFTLMEREKNAAAPAFDTVDKFPILDWWRHSRAPENSEWLMAPIGLLGGNKVRSLLFAADGDGVHGMVAGTTGSGKSELLLTLIVGLAMRYDPSVVNFVLADYKGGTAFDPFKPLPHAVDIVTSLQGLAGARTFTAMRAEMNRRSAMIANSNTKHIVHYRSKNLHVTREPFPFLFVIVDEFAEMVKENPEFKGNLDSITRLGRALGVSLILATQRPAGVVTDQMRSNMKWRICLRVETAEDSRELLKRSDASFLPPNIPGRGYLQVGNENVELMQVARAGGPYTGPQVDTEPAVIWLSRGPSAVDANKAKEAKGAAVEAAALSDVLVEIMAKLADENEDVAQQAKPWPDPLPIHLTLDQEHLPSDIEPNPLLPLNPAIVDWLEGEGAWHGIDWTERAMRATAGLIDNPIKAEQLPMVIDLNKGHAVIFGASGWGKTVFLRTVITALAATHSPNELNVYIMDFGGKGLDVITDLPHVAASVMPSEDDRVQGMLRRLADELEARKSLLSQARVDNLSAYNATHLDKIVPAMLCVIDNFAEFRENFEALIPELIAIARDGRAYGIHFIITAQQLNVIPGKLYNMLTERMTLRLADQGEYSGVVGRVPGGLPEITGRGFILVENAALEMQIALPVSVTREDEVAGLDNTKKLAKLVKTLRTAWGDGARPQSIDLAKALSLLELFSLLDKKNYDSVEKFPLLDWWRESRKPTSSNWLAAPIGLVTGNKVRALVFAADADGSHGMVAGTTGSGKSELLLTLVAGMAMRYDPSVVNFILADYKGGTAFDPFKELPHAVDIVTNLQGLAGARTFTAMRAEMNRRSVMLANTQSKHIIHYRSKNLHETSKPFPFLFVIVDEFAEMVKENPEFRGSLDSITRLGRALGVSLILATQRPAGVVNDQMRANMKWRICLRVETGEDSRELLKRPDAAFLPNNIPGRGYLQVGNENVELMQVARAGGPYLGPLPDFLKSEEDETRSAVEAPALSDVLTKIMHQLLLDHPDEVKAQIKPYPDPLPTVVTLEQPRLANDIKPNPLLPLTPAVGDWMEGEGSWKGIDWLHDSMRATIGLIDNPIKAEQSQLVLNLSRGHAVVFGASGWGKSSFLRSTVIALAATHSPEELHIYFMDFGGRGMDVLTDLPHVSSPSIQPSEDERVQRLLRTLGNELERRKQILSEARVEGLAAYNTANPDKIMPAILVILDNFAEFKENYENQIPEFSSIVRDGRAYGLHFIVTGDQPNAVPGKVFSLFTERYALKLSDAGEYTGVVGRGVPGVPECPGRGFVEVDRQPLEMQIAVPVKATQDEERAGLDDTKKLAKLVDIMNKAWGDKPRPQSIEILRTVIPLRRILPKTTPDRILTILGTQDVDLQPAALDLTLRGPHFILIGPPLSGKTTAMRSWVLSLASMYSPKQVALVLVDFQQRLFKYGGKRNLSELPHVLMTVSEAPQLDVAIKNLRIEYETPDRDMKKYPRPEIFILADNYDDFANVIGSATSTRSNAYRDLAELSRKYGPEGFHAVLCGSLNLMRSMDEFVRQVMAPRYGLGLDAVDSPSALGGRVRGGGGGVEFPPGRGYIVKSGRIGLMQVATPAEGGSMEDALDEWVVDICKKHPTRAEWLVTLAPELAPAPPAAPAAPATPGTAPAPTPGAAPAAKPAAPAPSGSDSLKAQMAELEKLQQAAMEQMQAASKAAAEAPIQASKPVEKPVDAPKDKQSEKPSTDGKQTEPLKQSGDK